MNVPNVGTNGRNEYLDILEAAWQDHLKPRESNAPTVISLFAGAGGSSLGYSMAGYRELLAVEWDDNAVATFKLNFPDVPVYHGDIHKLTVDECLKLAGLEPGQLDVLDGSPPCQGFSTAGKRQMDDQRNQLYHEYVRLLRGLRPKVFVMENVSGLVKGKMKLIFADIMRELKASGYDVKCRLMNTMYFNVPQSRQRLIWIGVRKDLEIEAGHPKGENRPFTVREAWNGLSGTEQDEHLSHCWIPVKSGSKTEKALKITKPGKTVGSFGGSKRLAFDVCSTTISTGGLCPGYPGSSWPSHPSQARGISIREGMRLASFPDGYSLDGDWIKGAKSVGNSVPPLFMRSIAQHISHQLLREAV